MAICGSGVGASVCANKVAGHPRGARPRPLLGEARRRGRPPQHPVHGRTDRRAGRRLGSRPDVPRRRVQSGRAPPAAAGEGGRAWKRRRRRKRRENNHDCNTRITVRADGSARASTPSARCRWMRSRQANSGHPGTPMALAPLVYTLWNRVMRFDPQDPIWPNRDRFVLSNGHASMLLWSVLHLTGTRAVNADYERLGEPSVTLDDIRRFRQLGSKAPGPSRIPLGFGRRDDHRPAGPGHRHQRRHGHRRAVARRPLQPPGLRDVRLQHLRRLRRRLPDGRRRRPKPRRSPAIWASTTSAGSTTTTTSPSKAARDSRSPKTSRPASWRYGWNVLRVGDANDIDRIEHALAVFRQTQGPAHVHHPRQPHRLRLAATSRTPPPPTANRSATRKSGSPSASTAGRRTRQFLVPDGVLRALRRRHRQARRATPSARGRSSSPPIAAQYPESGDRDRADAAPRAAGGLGSQPPGLPGRCEGRGRPRRLGQGAERARAERPVVPRRLGRPRPLEQDHAHVRRRRRFPGRHARAARTCTSASASTRWASS